MIFFALRVLARWQNGFRTSWGADDWLIVPAVIVLVANYIFGIIGSTKGLSADIWWLTPDEIDMVLYASYIAMLMYFLVVTFTKLSVLAFYLQIFPGRGFRNWTFTLMACNVACMVSMILATTFRCWPIEGTWLEWDGTFQGRCSDMTPLVWAGAILTILLDVATLVLPMPALWKLNMSIKKRVQIMLMFGVGTFVTITSMIRLRYIASLANTTNPSLDFHPAAIWSMVELSVGVMCACLPAARALLVRVMPRVLGFSSNRSAATRYADSGALSGVGAGAGTERRGGSVAKGASGLSGSSYSEDRKSSTAGKAVAAGRPRSTVSGGGGGRPYKTDYVTRARRRDEDSFIELEDMSDGIDHASLDKDDVVLVGSSAVHDKGVP